MSTSQTSAYTLADLPRLRVATVTALDADHVTAHRLVMLGFAPGTEVRFVRRAPFRGPLVIEVRGTQICLRVAQARQILVAPVPSTGRSGETTT